MSIEDDPQSELLRTQAVTTILSAMNAASVNVYGLGLNDWNGVVLEDETTVSSYSHFHRDGQKYRYETRVRVDVYRKPVT
jgi:hypothetical protein